MSTELPCLGVGDLKNIGQLPVQQVLGDCVLEISTVSSLFMFSKSKNPLLTLLLNKQVRVISNIQVNFRFKSVSEVDYIYG